MKPASQRDMLLALWMLFDDLIEDDPAPGAKAKDEETTPEAKRTSPSPPRSERS